MSEELQRDQRAQDSETHTAEPAASALAPPSSMLRAASASLGAGVVQRKLARRALQRRGAAGGESEQVHRAADQGLQGGAQSLPHLDRIQAAFGGHDVSGVEAHVGGPAARASEQMGASAYATGNSVGFAASPDLHTAAHEAAHVVQQRGGVQLSDGVGQAGDPYERHADAVADLVVQGRSAESALSEMSGGGAGGTVQRKETATGEPAGKEEAGKDQGGEHDAVFGGVARAVAAPKTWMVSAPGRYRDTVTAKLNKGEVVDLVDLGADQKFNQVSDARYKWWKVNVSRGAHVGKEGWVMANLLTTQYEVKDAGATETTKIGGGEVTVGTGQTVDFDGAAFGDNMFSLSYKGIDADKMRFLQFLWREIIGTDDKGKHSPVSATFTNSVGRSYQLTQGGTSADYGTPTKENWNTDTAHATDPFYEAGGAADRTADSATMMDQPGAAIGNVTKAFDDGAKSVVSRAHFNTFLVKGEKEVQSKTNINVEWRFAKKEEATGSPKGKHTAATGAAAALSPAPLADAFHEQFPAFKDLK